MNAESPELHVLKRRYAAGEYLTSDELYAMINYVQSLEEERSQPTLAARLNRVVEVLKSPTPSPAAALDRLIVGIQSFRVVPYHLYDELLESYAELQEEIESWEKGQELQEVRERALQHEAYLHGWRDAVVACATGDNPVADRPSPYEVEDGVSGDSQRGN